MYSPHLVDSLVLDARLPIFKIKKIEAGLKVCLVAFLQPASSFVSELFPAICEPWTIAGLSVSLVAGALLYFKSVGASTFQREIGYSLRCCDGLRPIGGPPDLSRVPGEVGWPRPSLLIEERGAGSRRCLSGADTRVFPPVSSGHRRLDTEETLVGVPLGRDSDHLPAGNVGYYRHP